MWRFLGLGKYCRQHGFAIYAADQQFRLCILAYFVPATSRLCPTILTSRLCPTILKNKKNNRVGKNKQYKESHINFFKATTILTVAEQPFHYIYTFKAVCHFQQHILLSSVTSTKFRPQQIQRMFLKPRILNIGGQYLHITWGRTTRSHTARKQLRNQIVSRLENYVAWKAL